MKSDRQIKIDATKEEQKRVFDNMSDPKDIYAQCSDGMWERRCWKNSNGRFGWDKWKKIK